MMTFNNEIIGLSELRKKYHLVSKWQISCLAHCRYSVIDKISEENKIEKHLITVNGRPSVFYNESIIDLILKTRPMKNETAPDNYIPQKELVKHLEITAHTLSELEFWCWDFKKYKKSFNSKIYYDFTEEAQDFYKRKLYKWRNPDRKHGTCWQK
jgi:hypothetical protein